MDTAKTIATLIAICITGSLIGQSLNDRQLPPKNALQGTPAVLAPVTTSCGCGGNCECPISCTCPTPGDCLKPVSYAPTPTTECICGGDGLIDTAYGPVLCPSCKRGTVNQLREAVELYTQPKTEPQPTSHPAANCANGSCSVAGTACVNGSCGAASGGPVRRVLRPVGRVFSRLRIFRRRR